MGNCVTECKSFPPATLKAFTTDTQCSVWQDKNYSSKVTYLNSLFLLLLFTGKNVYTSRLVPTDRILFSFFFSFFCQWAMW